MDDTVKNFDPMPILYHYLNETAAPASIPVDIVEYRNKGFAYRIYHDDLQELPEGKKEDFAEWLINQARKCETIIGLPVSPEVSTYE